MMNGGGTRGYGTGELRSYGYQGPPSISKSTPGAQSAVVRTGPVRAMDLGYDQQNNFGGGGYSNNNSGAKGGYGN
jgi:hypothetical protein